MSSSGGATASRPQPSVSPSASPAVPSHVLAAQAVELLEAAFDRWRAAKAAEEQEQDQEEAHWHKELAVKRATRESQREDAGDPVRGCFGGGYWEDFLTGLNGWKASHDAAMAHQEIEQAQRAVLHLMRQRLEQILTIDA